MIDPEADRPPLVAWYVIETDVESGRDEPVFTHVRGPFPSKEKAEREVSRMREAWEDAVDEWGENPYDYKHFSVQEKTISDFQIDQLERQDRDRYETTMAAVNAVVASLLADEGIGPLAGDDDG